MSEAQAAATGDTGGGEASSAPANDNGIAPESGAANDNGEAPAPPAPTGNPAKDAAAARKWSLKYEGQEREVSDEAELVTLAQKGLGADRRFEEAAQARKQLRADAEGFVQRLTDDPIGALSALHGDEGRAAQALAQKAIANPRVKAQIVRALMADPDGRALTEREILAQLEYEGMPEEQRREVDRRRALEERAQRADVLEEQEKRREQAAERQRQAEAFQARTGQYQQAYEQEMARTLAAVGLDAADPDVRDRWVTQILVAQERGQPITTDEAARRLAAGSEASRKGWIEGLGKLEGDELLAKIPKDVLAKIRASDAQRLTGTARERARATQTGQPRTAAAPRTPKAVDYSADQYNRALRLVGIVEAGRRMDGGEPLYQPGDEQRGRR